MSIDLSEAAKSVLPQPYANASFRLRRKGVFDGVQIDVFVDDRGEFAVLHPSPIMDYAHYVPRQRKLGLGAYKKTLDVVTRRVAKIVDVLPERGTVLEIGAAEGAFLAQLRSVRPGLSLMAIEPDGDTKSARQALAFAADFSNVADAIAAGVKADVVCLFHVFEHINKPGVFLEQIRQVLGPGGRVVIEVPSLDDPLLSVYSLSAYDAFYFQRQHPFVYSSRSLSRVLIAHGFTVDEMRPYQRYGLENHIAWVRNGKPGGDAALAETFASTDATYKAALEAKGLTDTVFAIAQPA